VSLIKNTAKYLIVMVERNSDIVINAVIYKSNGKTTGMSINVTYFGTIMTALLVT
jgi:hypothetical protein